MEDRQSIGALSLSQIKTLMCNCRHASQDFSRLPRCLAVFAGRASTPIAMCGTEGALAVDVGSKSN